MTITIPLFTGDESADLTFHRAPANDAAPEQRPCVLIFPGGGYRRLSIEKEGLVPASWLNTLGISAAILRYPVAPKRHPAQLNSAQRAVRLLRAQSDELGIDPDRLAVWGFSAGGHLASMIATLGDDQSSSEDDLAGTISARVDRAIMAYPVLSLVPPCHQGSSDALLGESVDQTARRALSTPGLVSPQTPPSFLFHTAEDAAVPVQGVYDFANGCAEHGVPHEVHVLQAGPHGVGLAVGRGNEALQKWPNALREWLRDWVTAVG
ncbi:MAG: alpha/beta hydrolase [Planctomycetota bacterium]